MRNLLLVSLILIALRVSGQDNDLMEVKKFSEGQAFTCITVDKAGNVWAGTNKAGLYYMNKSADPAATFSLMTWTTPDISNYVIQALAADTSGYIWVGHSGSGGTYATGGGIERINIYNTSEIRHFSPDRNAECLSYLERDGIGSMNSSSLTVDKNNTVWSAHRSHSLVVDADYYLTPGTLSFKRAYTDQFISKSTWQDYRNGNQAPELPYPAYTCNVPASKSPGSRRCESVACSKNEVWVSVYAYEYTEERKSPGKETTTIFLPSRILKYDLRGQYLGQLTFDSVGATPGGVFNSIYLSSNGNAWVGLSANKGFAARIKGCWTLLNSQNLPEVFGPDANVNVNAIWGNKEGQVFIGTNKGLIVYNGVGKVDHPSSYSLLTTTSAGLLSDNITGGISEKDSVQWVASSNGIMRIKSGNNFSIDKNYTFCNNPHINLIEAQTTQDIEDRSDFHDYTVETVICTQEGPNAGSCNAQYVYDMMKQDASLTTPIPTDFPLDFDFMNIALAKLGADALEMIGRKIVTSRVPITRIGFLGVDIAQYFDNTKQIPFGNMLNTSKDYVSIQKSVNPFNVQDCETYFLYNNPIYIIARSKWNKYVDNIFCGNNLESLEYDKVWVFSDDRNLTITNYTMPGHFLYPGKIERRVIEDCGQVKVITTGTGLHVCGDNILGQTGAVGNVITGKILFHNIDMRLKSRFETGN